MRDEAATDPRPLSHDDVRELRMDLKELAKTSVDLRLEVGSLKDETARLRKHYEEVQIRLARTPEEVDCIECIAKTKKDAIDEAVARVKNETIRVHTDRRQVYGLTFQILGWLVAALLAARQFGWI